MSNIPIDPLTIVIDFDSTFTKVEGLDELARIALQGNPKQQEIVSKIREITDKGMVGEYLFSDSLRDRVALLPANRSHVDQLITFLKGKISDSFQRNKDFLEEYADRILIISSGFKDFIVPVVEEMGIAADHVHANTFTYDAQMYLNMANNIEVPGPHSCRILLPVLAKLLPLKSLYSIFFINILSFVALFYSLIKMLESFSIDRKVIIFTYKGHNKFLNCVNYIIFNLL